MIAWVGTVALFQSRYLSSIRVLGKQTLHVCLLLCSELIAHHFSK